VRRYLEVWRLPGAPVLVVGGMVGRFPIAMVPLALLLLVAARTGSYASAGLATGAYTISTAVLAPVMGRLVDRLGPRPVLAVTGVAYPAALAGLIAVLMLSASTAVIYPVAALAGATFPVLSSSLRALWSQLAEGDDAVRQAAYALDSISAEVVFVSGPITVAALVTLASPAVALGVAAILTLAGTLAVAFSGPACAWRRHSATGSARGASPLRAPGMAVLLAGASALMFGFGVVEVAVPAFATREGVPALSGVLLGVWAVGSVCGGIWFGTRSFASPPARQWRWGLGLITLGMAPLALAGSPWILGALLLLAGMAIAPTMTIQNGLVAELAAPGTLAEAFTWLTTVIFGASALGSAAGGALVDLPSGVATAFGVVALSTAVAWLIASRLPSTRAPRTPLPGGPPLVEQPA
jgi:MFS family permease